jgi:ubiquinone/menaquinone biosynthesis C-methylase UbiE
MQETRQIEQAVAWHSTHDLKNGARTTTVCDFAMSDRNRYDTLAAGYDRRWRRYNQAVATQVWRALPANLSGARILDAAAGTGFFLQQLLRRHLNLDEIVALDASRAMLMQAQFKLQTAAQSSTRLRFVFADATCLPFKDNTFNVVLSMNALHYFDEPQKFFDQSYRVLEPGGVLVVQDYTRNGWPLFEPAMRVLDAGMQRLYSPRDLNVLARRAGFHVEQARHFRITRFWRGVLLRARKI